MPALQEAGQQDLVEVGVLDADDRPSARRSRFQWMTASPSRDVERAGHAGAGLLAAGEQGLRLGAAARGGVMSSV